MAAAVAHRGFGVYFRVKRLLGRGDAFATEPSHDVMPVVMEPPLSTREVAREASAVLPGVKVRRLLFWRYLLVWRKPAAGDAGRLR